MTRIQLEQFIERRNRSEFNSHLQFAFDARACGVSELIDSAERFEADGGIGYRWQTPFGELRETWGTLTLLPHDA